MVGFYMQIHQDRLVLVLAADEARKKRRLYFNNLMVDADVPRVT